MSSRKLSSSRRVVRPKQCCVIDTTGREGNRTETQWMRIGRRVSTCSKCPREISAHQDDLSVPAMFLEKHRQKGEVRASSRSWMKEGLAQEVPMKEKLLKESPSVPMP